MSIFYFKNFSRGVSVLQNSCCRRWPGLLRTCQARWCGFAPELDNCWNAFVRTMCFLLCFFLFCVPAFFFPFVFAKSMMRSFCLVNFCVLLHVFMCVVQNQLFIDLFASLFFCVFVYIPLLALFFAVFSCGTSLFFYTKLFKSACLCFCRFCMVPFARFDNSD